jgi:hypothetical protein
VECYQQTRALRHALMELLAPEEASATCRAGPLRALSTRRYSTSRHGVWPFGSGCVPQKKPGRLGRWSDDRQTTSAGAVMARSYAGLANMAVRFGFRLADGGRASQAQSNDPSRRPSRRFLASRPGPLRFRGTPLGRRGRDARLQTSVTRSQKFAYACPMQLCDE